MAELLKGKPVAEAINQRSREIVSEMAEKGITPALAIFRVGAKDSDLSYERGAVKRCEEVGVRVVRYIFDEDVSEEEFYEKLDEANNDDDIHGILVFRPLPKRFDDEKLRNSIAAGKDVDGCSDLSLAGVFTNRDLGFAPCTAQSVIEILNHYHIDPKGKNVVVLGRSLVIGKPVSMLLPARNATPRQHVGIRGVRQQRQQRGGARFIGCFSPGQTVFQNRQAVGQHCRKAFFRFPADTGNPIPGIQTLTRRGGSF